MGKDGEAADGDQGIYELLLVESAVFIRSLAFFFPNLCPVCFGGCCLSISAWGGCCVLVSSAFILPLLLIILRILLFILEFLGWC